MLKMNGVLNIYKTEIYKRYKVEILESTETLKDLWEEHCEINVNVLLDCICLQMSIMETVGITFYALSMDDIYITNGIFIMMGKTIKLDNETFTFLSPPILDKKTYFHYPEFLSQKYLPCSFHKSSIYYSIGLIILCILVGFPILDDKYTINDKSVSDAIKNTKGKQYYFLKRCFDNRELLFI
jgi:hypothetical protein